MRKRIFRLLALFILFASLSAHNVLAAHALPEFTAQYAIEKFNTKVGEAYYQLSHTGKGYKFTQNTKLVGFARMLAKGTVSVVSYVDRVGDNLLLKKYSYIQTGDKKNRNEDFNILWNTHKNMLSGKITGVARNKKIELRTNAEIWDALSFQIPLMIEANERIKEYPYRALLKGEINDYNFVVASINKINFAEKEYKTIHLVRTDPNKDRQLHIWLMPALNNIPVIIKNYRDGKEHSRMQLERLSINNKTYTNQQINSDNDDDF